LGASVSTTRSSLLRLAVEHSFDALIEV